MYMCVYMLYMHMCMHMHMYMCMYMCMCMCMYNMCMLYGCTAVTCKHGGGARC